MGKYAATSWPEGGGGNYIQGKYDEDRFVLDQHA